MSAMPTASSSPTGPLRLSSLVRAAGTTATVLSAKSPGFVRTTLLAGGAHVAAHRIDPAGLHVVAIDHKGDLNVLSGTSGRLEDQEAKLVQVASSTFSWVLANWLLARVAGRLPLPRVVSALLLGAGVYAADDAMVRLVHRLEASKEE